MTIKNKFLIWPQNYNTNSKEFHYIQQRYQGIIAEFSIVIKNNILADKPHINNKNKLLIWSKFTSQIKMYLSMTAVSVILLFFKSFSNLKKKKHLLHKTCVNMAVSYSILKTWYNISLLLPVWSSGFLCETSVGLFEIGLMIGSGFFQVVVRFLWSMKNTRPCRSIRASQSEIGTN